MDEHDWEARIKGLRRDFATELENVDANIAKIGKAVRAKADTDDVQQLSVKVSNVESDSRDGIKTVRSELRDGVNSIGRSLESLGSSVRILSESLDNYKRDADGRTSDTVNRILSERRPIHWSVPAISGAAGGGGVIGAAIYLISLLPHGGH